MALIDARQHVTQPEGNFFVTKTAIIGKAAHHSGAFYMAGETTEQDEINHIRMIDLYHVSRGFGGFGYHCAAFPSGRAYQTGDFDGGRAHVWGRNDELPGWVLIGDYSDELPSAGGLTAAAECERALDDYMGREVPLKGHRDWALPGHGTTCPGRVRERLSTIRQLAKEDDMTPEEVKQIARAEAIDVIREFKTRFGQSGALAGDLSVIEALVALETEVDAHNQQPHGGSSSQKVHIPGQTITVPAADYPVEPA